jgi:hypothetical protein
LPQAIVGTLGAIKVLLPSFPVNKFMLFKTNPLHVCAFEGEINFQKIVFYLVRSFLYGY